jgi:BirA family biotin operon repressor/biotin-[acetyl-CoA-carboxylase] ligase
MYIIKLDAIDSTNAYLKSMTSVALPKDFTVVASEVQTKGRGQMGTFWQSEKVRT